MDLSETLVETFGVEDETDTAVEPISQVFL
jgi:hypothetical protein